MDFSFDDEHEAVASLAAQIFAGEVTVERIKAVESGADQLDRRLWSTLAEAGLLGLGVSAASGGGGGDAIAVGRLFVEQGRHLAPVPLVGTVIGAAAVDAFGTDDQRRAILPGVLAGDDLLAVAFDQPAGAAWDAPATTATRDGDAWTVDGWLPAVAAVDAARLVVLPARIDGTTDVGVFLVDPTGTGAVVEPVRTTGRQPAGHLVLSGAAAEPLGPPSSEVVRWVAERTMVALSALTLGVATDALRRAAEHTTQRHQFGRPLSSFQSTAHKAADAHIDTEAMRATLWQAAWLLEEGEDPAELTAAVLVARWWAADGGQRVTHTVQHLHGGLGADIDHPVHRYFLWAKQLESALGAPSHDLARLGALIAVRARTSQEPAR